MQGWTQSADLFLEIPPHAVFVTAVTRVTIFPHIGYRVLFTHDRTSYFLGPGLEVESGGVGVCKMYLVQPLID